MDSNHIVIYTFLIFISFHSIQCIPNVTPSPSDKQNSVYFIESNSIYTRQSTWLSTFLITFDPYITHVDNLRDDLNSLSDLVYYYMENSHPPDQKDNHKTDKLQYLRLARDRIAIFHHKINDLNNMVRNMYALIGNNSPKTSRRKRALFNFLGKVLQGIAGVATEKDIRKINLKLAELANSNLDLTHILEDSVTVVNATRIKLSETINTVNSLTQVTDNLQKQFTRITAKLSSDIKEYEKFSFHWHQISIYFDLLQDAINSAFRHFETLHSQISDVLHHKLTPALITPIQLHKILSHISESISSSLSLPYDLDNDLMLYYQSIQCSLVTTSHGLMVVISIHFNTINLPYIKQLIFL